MPQTYNQRRASAIARFEQEMQWAVEGLSQYNQLSAESRNRPSMLKSKDQFDYQVEVKKQMIANTRRNMQRSPNQTYKNWKKRNVQRKKRNEDRQPLYDITDYADDAESGANVG